MKNKYNIAITNQHIVSLLSAVIQIKGGFMIFEKLV